MFEYLVKSIFSDQQWKVKSTEIYTVGQRISFLDLSGNPTPGIVQNIIIAGPDPTPSPTPRPRPREDEDE